MEKDIPKSEELSIQEVPSTRAITGPHGLTVKEEQRVEQRI